MQDNEKRRQHIQSDGFKNPRYALRFRQILLESINTLLNQIHLRQKHWLIAILFSWIVLYFYSEKGEAERNTTIIIKLIYLTVSFCFVLINSLKLKFSFRDTSFIVFVSMLIILFGSNSIVYHADMTAKSMYFYYSNKLCKKTNSNYLNYMGIKICYSQVYYPQARIILLSPRIDLAKEMITHHDSIVNELSNELHKENKLLEGFSGCTSVEVNDPLKKGIYYLRVFCQ
jgi:hypothetical protein